MPDVRSAYEIAWERINGAPDKPQAAMTVSRDALCIMAATILAGFGPEICKPDAAFDPVRDAIAIARQIAQEVAQPTEPEPPVQDTPRRFTRDPNRMTAEEAEESGSCSWP